MQPLPHPFLKRLRRFQRPCRRLPHYGVHVVSHYVQPFGRDGGEIGYAQETEYRFQVSVPHLQCGARPLAVRAAPGDDMNRLFARAQPHGALRGVFEGYAGDRDIVDIGFEYGGYAQVP